MTKPLHGIESVRAPFSTAKPPFNDWSADRKRGRPRKRQPSRMSEQAIQRAVFDHIKRRGERDVYAFHCPNGGARKRIEAAIFKGIGVRPGIPDVIIIHAAKLYALELKTEAGKLSFAQVTAQAEMRAAGCVTATTYGEDAAIRQLESWGILRGKATLRSGEAA